jgi:hypothetical protein
MSEQAADPQTRADLQKIEYWAKVRDEAIAEVAITIRGAHKRGASLAQLAEAAGLNEVGVQAIVDGPRQTPQGWLRVRLEREWE